MRLFRTTFAVSTTLGETKWMERIRVGVAAPPGRGPRCSEYVTWHISVSAFHVPWRHKRHSHFFILVWAWPVNSSLRRLDTGTPVS